jgi:hypothetical protein
MELYGHLLGPNQTIELVEVLWCYGHLQLEVSRPKQITKCYI